MLELSDVKQRPEPSRVATRQSIEREFGMSYCLNPACPKPENLTHTERCQACGTPLILNGKYRILQELGQGGFGATFLAIDESLPGKPHCVIKQLRPATSTPHVLQMARDLFKREAKTLGKIGDHPQVPRLLDYFDRNQEFYLVQEYISGSTLQQEVKRSGPFSEAGVKQFLSEILPMIQYIHSQQVIHRDIKPANLIRRNQDKKLVLIDFGAVKDKVNPARAAASEETALTSYAIGTPGYAPPEQMAMRPTYASDIYALGVTCLYLLTGKAPKDMDYDPTTGEILWENHVHVSQHFAGVLRQMLEVSVRHRFQSATDVLRSLDLVPYMDSLADSMVTARPTRPNAGGGSNTSMPNSTSSRDMHSSPTARLAAQIRARKSKNPSSGKSSRGQMPIGGQRRPAGASGPLSSGRSQGTVGRKRQSRPDLKQVLDAYARGHRNFSSYDLSALDLREADLSGANLHAAKFHQSVLSRVNLQKADLGGADFGQANLSEAVLRNTNLVSAFLTNADLSKADLRGANLSYANLSNANLKGANLCGADLTGAKVSDGQLALAKTNWKTVHPRKKRGLW
ncbi:MAG: serine/threonine-protein kinase [Leptolyngbyaceae bacterium]|nr:serine/threonine-protein kinase [Leptolyngbyaceae bacterium]